MSCKLVQLAKKEDKQPNPDGSWGIGSYSTEETGEADGYGFYRPKNPNYFWPDYESCTEWEIANHKAACDRFNATIESTAASDKGRDE